MLNTTRYEKQINSRTTPLKHEGRKGAMRKTAFTMIMIIILLLLVGLTASKLNQPLTHDTLKEEAVNAKISEESTTAKTETTQENEIETENVEISTQPSQTADTNEQSTPQKNDQQIASTSENIQTLENPNLNQNKNTNPPDGRIYYPTSSEQPYAYTPTCKPKEPNMPIIPLYPENQTS